MVESPGLRYASVGESRGLGPAAIVGGGKDGGVEYPTAAVYGSLTMSGDQRDDAAGDHWTKQVSRGALSPTQARGERPRLLARVFLFCLLYPLATIERERSTIVRGGEERRKERVGLMLASCAACCSVLAHISSTR